MTKCIKRIRDLFEHALYRFTLYLLTLLAYGVAGYGRWLMSIQCA